MWDGTRRILYTALTPARSNPALLADIDGSEEVESFKGDVPLEHWFGPRKGRGLASMNQLMSHADVLIYGRDIDGSGTPEAEKASPMRKKDLRLHRSDADMAIYGRDLDYSNEYESYSNRPSGNLFQ